MREGPKGFWIYVALMTLIAFLGVYWSFVTLSNWADKIGGLGFTMDEQYKSSVTNQGLAIPFITSGFAIGILFLYVVSKLNKENRPGYFAGFIAYGVLVVGAFLYAFLFLSIAALD